MKQFELCNEWLEIDDILDECDFIRRGKSGKISNISAVFDIEASSFYVGTEKQACEYAWVLGINGRCCRGRTWNEFLQTIDRIKDFYQTSLKQRFVIYIHNLGYEFQWFKDLFQWDKVFCLEERKPIYAITKDGIEFRCSYLLSGYSLAVVGNNLLKYKVQKMVGDLDYDKLRLPTTPLTDKEWGYILNDGLVVMAYIQEEIERLGSLAKLPYTKTGYVRNLCRDKCLKGESKFYYDKLMSSLTLSVRTYEELKRAYCGGFTHANHNYVGKECKEVASFDFTSSYPTTMLSEVYPMSSPNQTIVRNLDELNDMCKKYCCMFDVEFTNIRSKIDYEHYISKSKCYICELPVVDNGRIVTADRIGLTITEQDWFLIREFYEWDTMEVGNFYFFRVGYLPKELILTILELYENKTTLKGVKGKEVEYMVSKGMLNSVYGMCVTDPCKDDETFDNTEGWITNKLDTEELINQYNENRSRFLYYAWGVWITAYSRRNLFSGIMEFKNDYIYSDTDSIKVMNKDKHLDYINNYNKMITNKVKKCLKFYDIDESRACPKTIKGVEKPLGVWDYEGTYQRFKTLGAKRYMYEDNNEIHITISGVNKQCGVDYLKWKYKTNDRIFKEFKEGINFPPLYDGNKKGAGKMVHTYIDCPMRGTITDYLGNTGTYSEMSGVHLEPTGYELSFDDRFLRYLLDLKELNIR